MCRREGEERGRGDHFLFFLKKTIHLRGECRHQFRVLGEFKRGVDVAHEDWLGVREGTHTPYTLSPLKHKMHNIV
ncbi:hypothetical protein Hanom_Chr12g01121111 [Helianthus anomalus]